MRGGDMLSLTMGGVLYTIGIPSGEALLQHE
jgi:hypothetical protein